MVYFYFYFQTLIFLNGIAICAVRTSVVLLPRVLAGNYFGSATVVRLNICSTRFLNNVLAHTNSSHIILDHVRPPVFWVFPPPPLLRSTTIFITTKTLSPRNTACRNGKIKTNVVPRNTKTKSYTKRLPFRTDEFT